MQAMEMLSNYLTRGANTISGPFHPFSGAVDIIVVEQEDGSFKSSPWYVRFGKFQGVLKAKENLVRVVVNGADAGFHMHLDHKGEAYFLMVLDPDDADLEAVSRIDLEDGKIVSRTDSRRIFGWFGRKSQKGDGDLQVMHRRNSLERAEIAADLLETKWSTSLPAGNRRGKKPPNVPPSGKEVVEEYNNKSVCKDIVNSCNSGGDTANDDDYVVSNSKGECVENVMAKDSESLTVHGEISGGRNREVDGPPHEQLPEMTSTGEAREFDLSNNTMANFNSSNFILHREGAEEAVDGSLASDGSEGRIGEGEVASYIYYEEIETSTVRFNAAAPSSLDLYPVMNEQIGNNEKFTQETSDLSTSPNLESPSDDLRTELASLGSTREDSFGESSSQRSIGTLESEQSSSTGSSMQVIERARDITHLQLMAEDTFLQGIKELQLNTDKERCTWHEIQETTLMVGNQLHGEVKESIPLNSQVGFQITEPVISHAEESTPIFPSSNSISDHAEGNLVSLPCFEEAVDASIPGSKSSNSNMFPLHKDGEHALEGNFSQSISADEIQVEKNLILAPEGNIEEDMGNNITDKVASGVASGKDLDITGPLSTSPPSFHSHVNDLEASDAFVSPRDSVDLDSKSPESGICEEEFSKTKIDIGLVRNAAQVESTGEFAAAEVLPQSTTDQIGATFEPFVEMSLCKHLLFKGMGAEAASKAFDAGKIDSIFFANVGPSIIKNCELVVRISDHYYPWEAAAPIILGMVSFGQGQMFRNKGMIPVDGDESGYIRDNSRAIGPSKGTWKFWPFSFQKERTVTVQHLVSTEVDQQNVEVPQTVQHLVSTEVNQQNVEVPSQGILSEVSSMKKFVQSLTPSDEQLASLNLKEGCNLVNFNFETSVLGRQQVNARIYLWKWNTRIVVSDVDGTITKSDVLGQFMPLVGKDWSQTGVAHLFSSIKDNGYQFLYLSARAISQAYLTRQFLFNLKQDNKSLPDGPVVISPDGLFPSLYREVIRRAPHEFKISCLEDIKALFPPDSNPFYAGFGNRHTDEISYLKVGIPKGKIFTINPKGEVAMQHRVNTKSYNSLHSLVDVMFPATCWSEQEEFNSVNFWRVSPWY